LSRLALALAFIALVLFAPSRSNASPDPTLAPILGFASTAVPIAATTGLWLSGEGPNEGIRFDLGMIFLAAGTIVGPSIGQIYAKAGGDAWVSFILRAITGTVMLSGIGLATRGESEGAQSGGTALAVIAGIPTAFLAGWDIFGSSTSAVEAAVEAGHGRTRRRSSVEIDLGGFNLCSAFVGSRCP
jgi:hypothetical protein